MTFHRFTIRARLRMGFGLLIVFLLMVAGAGLYEMDRANDTNERIVALNLAKIELLSDMADSVHVVSRVVRSMALLQDKAAARREETKIVAARDKYRRAFATLQTMPLDAAGQQFVRELAALQEQVQPMNERFTALSNAGDPQAIVYLLNTAGPATTRWQDSIRDFMALQKKKSQDDAAGARQAYGHARQLMLGLTLFAGIAGILFALQISRSITLPLAQAVGLARTVAAGDLSAAIPVRPDDRTETGALLRALNDMNAGLNQIVRQVRQGAQALSSGAAEIANGNIDLSSRTEQQASALEETAASMEELTVTVQHNADHAQAASALAGSTARTAAQGGEAVAQVVEVMARIEVSSARMVDIIDVIDGIAFQTNILALNAAVEAARAGEQGRGFAVVAGEVRTLAQRSATAAREIKGLIDSSVDQVAEGGKVARQAGGTVQEIVGGIDRLSGIVAEIAAAGREQSTGIEQTNQAVGEMDQITQHNAALVEEVAATAASLKDQAAALEQVVSRFRLSGVEGLAGGPLPQAHGSRAVPRLYAAAAA